MLRSSTARWVLAVLVLIAVLGVLRFKPWQRWTRNAATEGATVARQELNVGFLPVT